MSPASDITIPLNGHKGAIPVQPTNVPPASRASLMTDFLYCLNTSTIRPTPLLEKIRIAGEAGYRAIEPWNDEITDYLHKGGSIADLKKALGDAGLAVVSVIALHGWIASEGSEKVKVFEE